MYAAKPAVRKPIYAAVFAEKEAVFSASTIHPAETIGQLNQKFFGRRAGRSVAALQNTVVCVFKKFMRQLPDGTTPLHTKA
jgi:phosphopantetheinyl transferase (holo-ACP synthase)